MQKRSLNMDLITNFNKDLNKTNMIIFSYFKGLQKEMYFLYLKTCCKKEAAAFWKDFGYCLNSIKNLYAGKDVFKQNYWYRKVV